MAFLIHSVEGGYIPSWEYLPAGAITPVVGMALYQNAGNLALASGTTNPTFISMTEREAALTAGDIIPVVRISEDIIWETEWSAAATSVKQGQKVTIAADGLRVTATTTGGVAQVVDMDGTAIGDKVRVRLVGPDPTAGGGG